MGTPYITLYYVLITTYTMSHGIGGNQNVIQGNVGSPHMAQPPTHSSATQQTVPTGLFPPNPPSVIYSVAQPVVSSQAQLGHTQPVYTQQAPVSSLYSNMFDGNRTVSPVQPTGIPQMPAGQPAPQYHNCTFTLADSTPRERNSKKIPSYDGTTNLEGCITNFSLLTKGWTDEERLLALREKLKGRAGQVLEGLDLQYTAVGQIVTLAQLIQALEQTLVGDNSEWLARLNDIKREEGESLEELAHRIRVYSMRAHGTQMGNLGVYFYLALRHTPLGDDYLSLRTSLCCWIWVTELHTVPIAISCGLSMISCDVVIAS